MSAYRKQVIFSLDDFHDSYKTNAMNYLWWLKSSFPTFKITLFTIPDKLSREGECLVRQNGHWLQIAIHGFNHDLNEVDQWDEAKCNEVLDICELRGTFVKGFKAPNWTMTDTMRKVLQERGYWLADQHKNHDHNTKNFPKLKLYCECTPNLLHGHTWRMQNPKPELENGIETLVERDLLKFDDHTEFQFIDELFNPDVVVTSDFIAETNDE